MSTNNIEIEAKVLLDKEAYERVKDTLHFSADPLQQTNYYLDSPERILQHYGMILRIREMNGIYKLTCKAPLSEGLLEKNQVLKPEEAKNLIEHNVFPRGEIMTFLEMLQFDIAQLKVLATLVSQRIETDYLDYTLDLSVNTYGNKTDYELECDADSSAHAEEALREICLDNDIEFKLNPVSKENRAIHEALKK